MLKLPNAEDCCHIESDAKTPKINLCATGHLCYVKQDIGHIITDAADQTWSLSFESLFAANDRYIEAVNQIICGRVQSRSL